jgi:hypothetical protein
VRPVFDQHLSQVGIVWQRLILIYPALFCGDLTQRCGFAPALEFSLAIMRLESPWRIRTNTL